MEQDWKERLKAEILEDMKKEAIREWTEEKTRMLICEKWDDETIAENLNLDIEKVHRIRENHKKWEFAKQLEITEESAYLEDDNLVSKCLPKDMYQKRGKLDGAESMLMLGLHAVGLKRFLEAISDDTKEALRTMLKEQGSYQMLSNLHVINNKDGMEQISFWQQEVYSSTELSDACLDVHLLLREGFCKYVESDEKKNEE